MNNDLNAAVKLTKRLTGVIWKDNYNTKKPTKPNCKRLDKLLSNWEPGVHQLGDPEWLPE